MTKQSRQPLSAEASSNSVKTMHKRHMLPRKALLPELQSRGGTCAVRLSCRPLRDSNCSTRAPPHSTTCTPGARAQTPRTPPVLLCRVKLSGTLPPNAD